MKKLILMLFCTSLAACAETKEYVFIPIDKMPKTASKKPVKTFKGKVVKIDKSGKAPKLTPSYFQVYDVGPTIDAEGNLVGQHKLYRVVQTSRWEWGPPKTDQPIPLKPKTETVDAKVIEKAREAAREEVRQALGPRTVQAKTDNNNPEAYREPALPENNISTEEKEKVQNGFSIYPQPTPTPDAIGALERYTQPQN